MTCIFNVEFEECAVRLQRRALKNAFDSWVVIDYGSDFFAGLSEVLKKQAGNVVQFNTFINITEKIKENFSTFSTSMRFVLCLPEINQFGLSVFNSDELQIVKNIFHLAGFLQKTYAYGEGNKGDFFIVGKNISASPVLSGLAGLVKILNREWSDVNARFISIEEKDSSDAAASIFREISYVNTSSDIYYKNHTPYQRSVYLMKESFEKPAISAQDVFLVTAGAGGITAQCCLKLAQETGCSFILLGRTPLHLGKYEALRNIAESHELMLAIKNVLAQEQIRVTPKDVQNVLKQMRALQDIENTLNKFQTFGSRVKYYVCDIAQQNILEDIVEQYQSKWGPITGIIHGAGNLVDKLIRDKTEEDIDAVILPKVRGLLHLINLKNFNQVKWCIIFSSVSSLYGNKGQSAYAVANEILNQASIRMNALYPNCKTIALCWGAWELGMVSENLKAIFAKRGISLLTVGEGTQLFWRSLSIEQPYVILDKNENMQQRFQEHRQKNCLLDRQALEDLSLHADVSNYFGDDYLPMLAFNQRLRMPAPPFLFVSRVLQIVHAKKPGCLGEMWFEYDIPSDILFQGQGRVHEFVLAESCHAVAVLAYVLLKNELLSSPSALRGSNGTIEFYGETPMVGQTIQVHLRVESILTVLSGKLLKQVFVGSCNAKPLFKIESYAAIIDPEKIQPTVLPAPRNHLAQNKCEFFAEMDLQEFYCLWDVFHPSCALLHRVKIYSLAGPGNDDVIVGEFDLSPDYWVFSAHFVDDSLFPASLIHCGFYQLLVFYASTKRLCLLSHKIKYARNVKTKRKLIHSLFPCNETIFFQLEVEIKNTSSIVAKAVLYTEKLLLAEFENVGLEWSVPNES